MKDLLARAAVVAAPRRAHGHLDEGLARGVGGQGTAPRGLNLRRREPAAARARAGEQRRGVEWPPKASTPPHGDQASASTLSAARTSQSSAPPLAAQQTLAPAAEPATRGGQFLHKSVVQVVRRPARGSS